MTVWDFLFSHDICGTVRLLAPLPTHRLTQRLPKQAPRALRTCRRWSCRSFFGKGGVCERGLIFFDLSYIDYVKSDACEDTWSRAEYRETSGERGRKKSVMVERRSFTGEFFTGEVLLKKFLLRKFYWRSFTGNKQASWRIFYWRSFTGENFTEEILLEKFYWKQTSKLENFLLEKFYWRNFY